MMGGVVFAALLLIAEPCPPTPTTHATDEQNLWLSKAARRDLSKRLVDYELRTGHQIFVWVGATTIGEDLRFPLNKRLFRFAFKCLNAWGIGRPGYNDGVVLFFFVADDASWIAMGYGIETQLGGRNKANMVAERIHKKIISPLMRAKKYEEAINSGVNAVLLAIGDK